MSFPLATEMLCPFLPLLRLGSWSHLPVLDSQNSTLLRVELPALDRRRSRGRRQTRSID